MDNRRIAVMGAGNSGYATAAYLTLAGYEVKLCKIIKLEDYEDKSLP